MKPRRESGFTLIELMIVVAIIGILANIALPTFSNLVAKSQEATTLGNLGALRSASALYYGDLDGMYPVDADALTLNGRYLAAIPNAYFPKTSLSPGHSPSNFVTNCTDGANGQILFHNMAGGTYLLGPPPPTNLLSLFIPIFDTLGGMGGGWVYDGARYASPTYGSFYPNCGHSDLRGSQWSQD